MLLSLRGEAEAIPSAKIASLRSQYAQRNTRYKINCAAEDEMSEEVPRAPRTAEAPNLDEVKNEKT